jgi:hypothetical protein
LEYTENDGCGMRTGAANHLKTVGGCLKDLDHLSPTVAIHRG